MSGTRFTAFCLVTFCVFAAPRCVNASDLVVVLLNDGRMLAGEVDPRTSDERLWLRSASPTFVVATSAAWEHIKAVNANGERLSVEAFVNRVDEFRPKQAAANALPGPARDAKANVTTSVTRPFQQSNAATRVVSLDVEARVANWDQDAATDGVEIRVLPRNTFGEIVPVSGQITATLLARNQLPAHDPNAFPQLGRWSLQADTNDFGPYGAVYRLPFRGKHPDEEFALEPDGLVEVTFYAFGQGRYTSDASIYLRRFNPIRRDMQRHAADRGR
ncbi:MAG: hypothetical protein O3C40_00020 [Planctomycetota bacterium]|nr:hypothetical protein [Planctomycetota bacterium]